MTQNKNTSLPDEIECAEMWLSSRWSEDIRCVECDSGNVERRGKYREYLHRYYCKDCGKWFNDMTGTPLQASKVSLSQWFYMMKELDKGQGEHGSA